MIHDQDSRVSSLRKRITPELLRKSLDPEFQRNLRADEKVRDYYRLRMETDGIVLQST